MVQRRIEALMPDNGDLYSIRYWFLEAIARDSTVQSIRESSFDWHPGLDAQLAHVLLVELQRIANCKDAKRSDSTFYMTLAREVLRDVEAEHQMNGVVCGGREILMRIRAFYKTRPGGQEAASIFDILSLYSDYDRHAHYTDEQQYAKLRAFWHVYRQRKDRTSESDWRIVYDEHGDVPEGQTVQRDGVKRVTEHFFEQVRHFENIKHITTKYAQKKDKFGQEKGTLKWLEAQIEEFLLTQQWKYNKETQR